MKKILFLLSAIVILGVGCKKTDVNLVSANTNYCNFDLADKQAVYELGDVRDFIEKTRSDFEINNKTDNLSYNIAKHQINAERNIQQYLCLWPGVGTKTVSVKYDYSNPDATFSFEVPYSYQLVNNHRLAPTSSAIGDGEYNSYPYIINFGKWVTNYPGDQIHPQYSIISFAQTDPGYNSLAKIAGGIDMSNKRNKLLNEQDVIKIKPKYYKIGPYNVLGYYEVNNKDEYRFSGTRVAAFMFKNTLLYLRDDSTIDMDPDFSAISFEMKHIIETIK